MIHSTALVSKYAKIGKSVVIGAFSIIHDNVIIGDHSVIEAYCEIGHPTPLAKQNELIIENNALIRSHTVIYAGSHLGNGMQTGHRVTIRENTKAGKDWKVGTSSDIQGDTEIGDHVRMHSNVFISKGAVISNFAWLFPYVVLTDDPHPPSNVSQGVIVEEYAAIGARSTILPGLTVGKHSLVGAHSCVTKNVPPNMLVRGVPAKIIGETASIQRSDDPTSSAYPWPKHFHRGYPDDVIKTWMQEF